MTQHSGIKGYNPEGYRHTTQGDTGIQYKDTIQGYIVTQYSGIKRYNTEGYRYTRQGDTGIKYRGI